MIEPKAAAKGGIEPAIYLFAKRVARIPSVLGVSYSAEKEVYLVWTFITERNKAVRREIYQEELNLMQEVPWATFDFNVVALDQLEPHSLVPDDLQGQIVFYRELPSE